MCCHYCLLDLQVPSPLLNHKFPYQVLFGSRPDYDSLRTFGCLAFATTLPSTRNKFSPRVVLSVFVGYPRGYKGYKLYNMETKQFYISRDVIFHKIIFLFHSNVVDQELLEFCNNYVVPLLFLSILLQFLTLKMFIQQLMVLYTTLEQLLS